MKKISVRVFLAVIFAAAVILTSSCTNTPKGGNLLEYQDCKLDIIGNFTVGDESFRASLCLEGTEYDGNGRMMSRDAKLTILDNSIISGVSIEIIDGKGYISAGEIRIPVDSDELLSGVNKVVSLFCISADCYHHTENSERNGVSCFVAYYRKDSSEVRVYIDSDRLLPVFIEADDGDIKRSVEITDITAR